ncbi:MAG: hypothetical protein QME12_01030 [Nanoarchaeota archaeon]|nr:hypothetical protein [Nanoarchaeota archaeon]
MGLANKIGKGMTLVGLIGWFYTSCFTVPKPLLAEGDNKAYSSYREHPDYYWLPDTFMGIGIAGLIIEGSTCAYERRKNKKEKKKE